MNIEIIPISVSIIFPTLAGYVILRTVMANTKLPWTIAISLSYGLGFGILSLGMFIIGISHFTYNRINLYLMLLAFIFLTMLINKALIKNQRQSIIFLRNDPSYSSNSPLWTKMILIFEAILAVYIIQIIYLVFWRACAIPISCYDAIATIAFKAKIFFYEHHLPNLALLPHRSYPLLVPLSETWVALNLGYWNDALIKVIFPCAFISYLVVQYYFLKYFTGRRTWALVGCAILLSANFFVFHATISYRDFFLMYYNCITIMLLLLWSKEPRPGLLTIAGLMSGFATFTKLEGSAFLLVYYFLFAVLISSKHTLPRKEKLWNFLRFMLPGAIICGAFHFYKILNHVHQEGGQGAYNKTTLNFGIHKLAILHQIINRFGYELFFSGNWSILWFVMLVSLINWRKSLPIEVKVLALGIGSFFALYSGVALFTGNDVWIVGENSITTLSRLVLHFFPLSVLLTVLLMASNDKKQAL